MFTGIIERTARVVSLLPASASIAQIIIDPGADFDTKVGDSVAVNGCCLTVVNQKVGLLAFDVSRETLAKTTLGALVDGAEVNIERAMRLGDRLGGHLVSGHVDGVATVSHLSKRTDGWLVEIDIPEAFAGYIIRKGSICLEGVSLTVNDLVDHPHATTISVMLIPTTVSLTNFKHLATQQRINFEVDQMAKFIERQQIRPSRSC